MTGDYDAAFDALDAATLDDGIVDAPSLVDEGAEILANGGPARGDSTGWANLDPYYTVATKQWTAVTGVPGMGKSEFVDALAVNLAESAGAVEDAGWEFCIYSPENFPTSTHLIKLVEKRLRKPARAGFPGEPPMTVREYRRGAEWVVDRFFWLTPKLATPERIIDAASRYKRTSRKLGIVMDPWNTLDHERGGRSETDYISDVLTRVTCLVRDLDAHVWLVVHPTKLAKDRDGKRPIPTPYDLAGSAHWYNKAYNILCIHRAVDDHTDDRVDVHVQKVKYKHIGRAGHAATLRYAYATGRYFDDPGAVVVDLTTGRPERYKEPR